MHTVHGRYIALYPDTATQVTLHASHITHELHNACEGLMATAVATTMLLCSSGLVILDKHFYCPW